MQILQEYDIIQNIGGLNMITVLNIVGIVILLGCLIGIYMLFKNDKINNLVYKINMCEKELDETLKAKKKILWD